LNNAGVAEQVHVFGRKMWTKATQPHTIESSSDVILRYITDRTRSSNSV